MTLRRHAPILSLAVFILALVGCLQEAETDSTQDPQDMNRTPRGFGRMPMLPVQGPRVIPHDAPGPPRPNGTPLLPTDAPDTNGKTSTSLFDPINNAGGFSVDIAQSPGTEYRLAQMQFPSPRPITCFAGVLLANNPGSFGPIVGGFRRSILDVLAGVPQNDLWVLGRIRIGLQGVTFPIYFDMPIGDVIQLPVIAETVEISARLIKGIEIDLTGTVPPPFVSSAVQDLVEPPVFALTPGHQVSPAIVNANAYIGQGITAESNALRFAVVKTSQALGTSPAIIIPDGVNQVRVTAGDPNSFGLGVPLTGVNWGFATGQLIGGNGAGIFAANDCCWRDIPPNAIGIQLIDGIVGSTINFEIEFKLGLQGTF